LGENGTKNTDQSWRKLHREEKQFEDTLTDEMVEENYKNLSRLLKLTRQCESVKNDNSTRCESCW
jgi:uncharacterized protein with NRDE domain